MQLLDRFAAHIAHLLNQQMEDGVWLDPASIMVDLLDLLSSRYAGPLLFHGRYEWRMDSSEAAARYFEATLERKLFLSGKVSYSSAHWLFLSLVQRLPSPGWRTAFLVRQHSKPQSDNICLIPKHSASLLNERIALLSKNISIGNAAKVLKDRDGPLWLVAGHVSIELPDEMSIWDSIVTVPPKITPLVHQEAFNKFCGVVIDVMRTANRPFQEILGLGHNLCPFDWIGTISTNQVRSLRRYLSILVDHQTLADWSQVQAEDRWKEQPVAGYPSFDAFWQSEIIKFMRGPKQQNYSGEVDDSFVLTTAEKSEEQGNVMSLSEWVEQLSERVREGKVTTIESELLIRLYEGETFSDLYKTPAYAGWLDLQGGVDKWVESLINKNS